VEALSAGRPVIAFAGGGALDTVTPGVTGELFPAQTVESLLDVLHGSVVFQRRGDAANAKQWEGWRVGNLRPTFEPILWFVKPYPIGTTIADNVVAHGVGAFNEQAFVAYEHTPDNVLRSGFAPNEGGRHVAQKPVRLLRALIELTTLPGQVVLDPFCGSGSTLVAAKSVGRCYIGFDNDEACVRDSQERLAPDMFESVATSTSALSGNGFQPVDAATTQQGLFDA
jgi:site-specific DNA-methyltransferase (adenine-specific)